MPKYIKTYKTKIGSLAICSDNCCITNIFFSTDKIPNNIEEKETKVIKQAIEEIEEYLDGRRKIFTVPIKAEGTEFQKKVWKALQEIQYGKTCSYKDIANNIACFSGYRAVGSANGKNPIPIIIPCHRIINSNGGLGGFSGGLEMKVRLLKIEGIDLISR